MEKSKSLNSISYRGQAPQLKEGKHCRDLGTRKKCVYIYKQRKLKAQYLLDTLANSSHIRMSRDKARRCIVSVFYSCTHLWPRTAWAKCREMLAAQSSRISQTTLDTSDKEPVPDLTMPTATLQSHAKQESAYLLFYNRNACRVPQY